MKISAGESDIDQLYRIQKCLGPLPPKYMEAMKVNPKFETLKVFKKAFFKNSITQIFILVSSYYSFGNIRTTLWSFIST
jgi:hypothetical protein